MRHKILAAGVLAAFTLGFCGTICQPVQTAEASVIKHKTFTTSEQEKRDISYLKRHCTLSQDEIADMMVKGNTKEDIENLYILHSFLPKDDYTKLQSRYVKAHKDVDSILEEENISKDDFQKALERTFPKEDSDFDRVQRIKNLRYQKF